MAYLRNECFLHQFCWKEEWKLVQKVYFVRQLENAGFSFLFPHMYFGKIGEWEWEPFHCFFLETQESGDITMTDLTSHGPKGLLSRTFWPRDEKIGIVFLMTEAIGRKSQSCWLPCCLLVCRWIRLNGEPRLRDGGSGWAEHVPHPQFLCWSSDPPVPQNVTVFGDRAFKEVIKVKWGP